MRPSSNLNCKIFSNFNVKIYFIKNFSGLSILYISKFLIFYIQISLGYKNKFKIRGSLLFTPGVEEPYLVLI